MEKHKFASISLTVQDRAISSNFLPTGYPRNVLWVIFKKTFPLPKNGSHFEFSNFCQKWKKRKFASISLIVRDRVISLKYLTHRVSEQCTIGNFQKNFTLPKNGGLNRVR